MKIFPMGRKSRIQVIRLVLDKDAAMRKGLTVAQIFSELNGKLTESTDAATVTIDGRGYEDRRKGWKRTADP